MMRWLVGYCSFWRVTLLVITLRSYLLATYRDTVFIVPPRLQFNSICSKYWPLTSFHLHTHTFLLSMASTMGSAGAIITASMIHFSRTILLIRTAFPIAVMNKHLKRAMNSLLSGSIPALFLFFTQYKNTTKLELSMKTEIAAAKDEMKDEIQGVKDEIQGVKDEIQGVKARLDAMEMAAAKCSNDCLAIKR